jgi:hypothetical protein
MKYELFRMFLHEDLECVYPALMTCTGRRNDKTILRYAPGTLFMGSGYGLCKCDVGEGLWVATIDLTVVRSTMREDAFPLVDFDVLALPSWKWRRR